MANGTTAFAVLAQLGHFTQVITLGDIECMTTMVTPNHVTMLLPSQDFRNPVRSGSNPVI